MTRGSLNCLNRFHKHKSPGAAQKCRDQHRRVIEQIAQRRQVHINRFSIAYDALVNQLSIRKVCAKWRLTRTQLNRVFHDVVRELVTQESWQERYSEWWARGPWPVTDLRGDLELIIKLKQVQKGFDG